MSVYLIDGLVRPFQSWRKSRHASLVEAELATKVCPIFLAEWS